jgi:HK97 family phage major capsid protein
MNISEILQSRKLTLDKMKSIIERAEDLKRDLLKDEEIEYRACDKEIDRLNSMLEKKQRVEGYQLNLTGGVVNPLAAYLQSGIQPESRDTGGFTNLAEMLWAIKEQKSGRRDERLEACREVREQSMGTGTAGGFALPRQFIQDVKFAPNQGGIVRPRATIIPAGDPPDAELDFPSLDQTPGKNNFGGVSLAHSGEGITLTETDLALRQVTMTPKEISAYLVSTNKLLRNWSAGGVFISTMLRNAMIAQEDFDFLRGDSINKSLGIINSPCAIPYSRAGAGLIAWADIYGMVTKLKMGGNPIWIASQTIIPQLAAMVDAGTHAVFIGGGNLSGSAAGGLPTTLFGIPLVFSDRLPALGTKGDLVLADLSAYIIKDGSGPFVDLSEHIYFTSDKSVFRIVWNVDGHPWLTEPLRLEGDASVQVSPFVVLN